MEQYYVSDVRDDQHVTRFVIKDADDKPVCSGALEHLGPLEATWVTDTAKQEFEEWANKRINIHDYVEFLDHRGVTADIGALVLLDWYEHDVLAEKHLVLLFPSESDGLDVRPLAYLPDERDGLIKSLQRQAPHVHLWRPDLHEWIPILEVV